MVLHMRNYLLSPPTPYPFKHYRGFMLSVTREVGFSADVTGKLLSYVKYSSKRSGFLGFYLYLCHVIDDYCLSCIAVLRQVKNLTWQNPVQLFAAQDIKICLML